MSYILSRNLTRAGMMLKFMFSPLPGQHPQLAFLLPSGAPCWQRLAWSRVAKLGSDLHTRQRVGWMPRNNYPTMVTAHPFSYSASMRTVLRTGTSRQGQNNKVLIKCNYLSNKWRHSYLLLDVGTSSLYHHFIQLLKKVTLPISGQD